MSWQSLFETSDVHVADSLAETNRFGFEVSRIEVPHPADEKKSFIQVMDAISQSESDVIVLRYPAVWADWFARLRSGGRDLIHADTLMYWAADLIDVDTSAFVIEPFVDDWNATVNDDLRTMVAATFAGYSNHYAANPLFDPKLALAGYVEWFEHLAHSGELGLLRNDAHEPLGFFANMLAGNTYEVVLSGSFPAGRGKGVYRTLFQASILRAMHLGCKKTVVSTQAQNVIVQKTWAKHLSMRPVGAFNTVHVVKPGLLPD